MYPFDALGFRDNLGIDSKITSFALYSEGLSAMAISGPSYDQQPVFQFSGSLMANRSHVGMPDRWEFPWVKVDWYP